MTKNGPWFLEEKMANEVLLSLKERAMTADQIHEQALPFLDRAETLVALEELRDLGLVCNPQIWQITERGRHFLGGTVKIGRLNTCQKPSR